MGFGDLSTAAGVSVLNEYLADKSYIEGYEPSQADTVVFKSMKSTPSVELFHALRWYNHILSFRDEADSFPGTKKSVSEYGPSVTPSDNRKKAAAADDDDDDDDDDDFDMLASDDEEEQAAAEERRKKAEAAYYEKKAKKPAVIAKSSIILDVKPWEDSTDLVEMERLVRTIQTDGLVWGASKLIPVAYGIKKLQIMCVVEDDKVGTDFLEENILGFEDHVQSVDIAAFNKI
ncbi:elongation factor 1-beta-like [Tubulanus polymorphus]|uniref:elongation factor 1-beta-like n=1 Tax=Tubulanus polymorphus TaxID=672921 RepID=UPI003DA5097F